MLCNQGAYEGEVVPCFTGDAAFTNALRLDDMAEWTAAVRAGLFGRRKGAMPAAFEHPRFYTVEVRDNPVNLCDSEPLSDCCISGLI